MTSELHPAPRTPHEGSPSAQTASGQASRSLASTVLPWAVIALVTAVLGVWSFDWTWFVITAVTATAAVANLLRYARGSSRGRPGEEGRRDA